MTTSSDEADAVPDETDTVPDQADAVPDQADAAPDDGPVALEHEPLTLDDDAGDQPATAAGDEDHGFTSGPVGKDVDFRLPMILLFGPIAAIALGAWLFPSLFFDRFVDPYYWTPIKQDLGFNPINTATWAVLLVVLLFWLDRIVRRVEQPMTFGVIIAVVPYIVGGSILRVFEDTKLITEPLRYFFITPIIYVVITMVAVAWLIIGHALKVHSREVDTRSSLIALGTFLGAITVAFLGWGLASDDLVVFSEYGAPFVYKATFVLALCFAVPYYAFWRYTEEKGSFEQVPVMGVFGTAFLLFMVYLLLVWIGGQRWGPKAAAEPELWVLAAMVLAPGIGTAVVYWVAKRLSATRPNALAYLVPVNLLLIFSQTMDGAMTALGIDQFGYQEKHVLPDLLIRTAATAPWEIIANNPTAFVFLPLKVVVSLLVVYAIDIWARDDMERYPNLVMLAKMAIIIVGLAPGVRNSVRLAMQV